jgi:hypothetical protein
MNTNMDIGDAHGGRGRGGGRGGRGGRGHGRFELGAGGPLTDKSIPQTQMDEVPEVAEASREVGGGGEC